MALPRYVLTPTYLTDGVFGWQLSRQGKFLGCHEGFTEKYDRDVEAAMDWAEQIIGTRQDWRHTRVGNPERCIATGGDHATVGDDVLRSLEPGTPTPATSPR
ncbi:hypothetical protein [Streptomyces katrae]|uniref:Uncharacterized protein n=1 Tax=Streptomyces katrae TaxID=68223 RepID=A0A0F4J8J0_9ACTN|nr:hypothetical protein [Streptomyces katrae]KJY30712.1 hypothetical protein VR44_19645 [Streptomyces katrae]